MIGALQRFRDRTGESPKARDCRALQSLPSTATLRKEFGAFSAALRAAGMVPPSLGLRRRRWTAVEAANVCYSFRLRNGRWPDAIDVEGRSEGLPGRSVMIRVFGSTRPGEVGEKAEAILGITPGRGG